MSALLFDHLWQSTAVLAAIGILTMFFRNNSAYVRHALWTATSIKFLVPFAVLSELGRHLSTLLSSPVPEPPMVNAFYGAAQPFSSGAIFVALPAPNSAAWLPLLAIWGAGFFLVAAAWLSRWLKLRAVLRQAREAEIEAPMRVKFSPTQLEPGLIGILRPVLLLPEGITERLSQQEMDAILAHEICHLRRRDNLLAAIHMLVEAMFWFYPPVWWIGTRLLEERERACDESVLAQGQSPQIYAESILKVCQFYLHSPLDCAAGISGAGLKQRLEEIMENKLVYRLKNTKKALLAVTALLAVAVPFTLGLFHAPSARAQTSAPAAEKGVAIKNGYTGPLPYRIKFTLTYDERGNPLALMLSADTCDKGENKRLHCRGNVALSMPAGIATGDAFTADMQTRELTLAGNVVMFAGVNRMNGASLTLDANTGVIHMNGQDVRSGYPGMPPAKPITDPNR